MRQSIYLDCNASTPLRASAQAAMVDALAGVGNPSSVHRYGRLARRLIEDARERVAGLVGAAPRQVVFTGGATEANNWALHGTNRPRRLASAVEHPSVLATATDIGIVPVDTDGIVDLTALERMLAEDDRPAIVSLMLANNETGVVQPVAEAARIAHAAGALLHCDAVQAVGRISVDFSALGADLMSMSAHKIGGPQGAGALVIADGVATVAMQRGGGQELGRRAGTENVSAIAGFGAAADELHKGWSAEAMKLASLRDRLEDGIGRIAPNATILGSTVARVPNTVCVATERTANDVQVMSLDLAGIAVSAGAACSSGKVGRSHVLAAMGVSPALAGSAIRVSVGWHNEAADIDRFLDAWRPLALRDDKNSAAAPAA
jgi:cysteine desulfurase